MRVYRKFWLVLGIAGDLCLGACKRSSNEADKGPSLRFERPERPRGRTGARRDSPSCTPRARGRHEREDRDDSAAKEALTATVSLPGEITSIRIARRKISSPVAGRIEVSFREGRTVKRGDVLALIRVPELGNIRSAYTAAIAKAKAAPRFPTRVAARQASRFRTNIRDADAQAQALEAESRSLGEQLTGLGAGAGGGSAFLLALRAAIDGTVIHGMRSSGSRSPRQDPRKHRGARAGLVSRSRLRKGPLGASHRGCRGSTSQCISRSPSPWRYSVHRATDRSVRSYPHGTRVVLANPEGLIRIDSGTAQVAKGTPARTAPRRAALHLGGGCRQVGGFRETA